MAKRVIHAAVKAGVTITPGDAEFLRGLPRRFFRVSTPWAADRERFVHEALTWIGTPYHPHARVKHGGVDCAQFLAGAAEGAGLVMGSVDLRRDYSIAKPAGNEYTDLILRYCYEIPETDAQRGDIVLYKTGHGWMHSGIVLDWTE